MRLFLRGSIIETTQKISKGGIRLSKEVSGGDKDRQWANSTELTTPGVDTDPAETHEWLDSLDMVVEHHGMERAHYLLTRLLKRAAVDKVRLPALVQTPYVNTIAPDDEPAYPGNEAIERRIRRYIRWNAVAMVMRGNMRNPGLGGHLATYASAATLYEVGFQHFFRGKENGSGDQVYFQGHSSPGIYARAFLEGRLTTDQLDHFRREVTPGQGLSSYPHPWLMPNFWEFPTVSMGLGPIAAIYQARFNRYLHSRGICDTSQSRVWCFVGDGESDEPETLGALHLAASEGLNNLTFVVNCNLQRLDGPVRGNGKIIQELEATFNGAGWRVLKVIWGRQWDPLLTADTDGLLVRRMGQAVDGDYQKYSVESGGYIRKHFFGTSPVLAKMVDHLSDDDLRRLRRGGHDFRKVYAAYHAACQEEEKPVVILAKTVKGWTLGAAAEGKNIAHQAKKMSISELRAFRDLLNLDVSDEQLADPPLLRFSEKSPEYEYLQERRKSLGGYVPLRKSVSVPLNVPDMDSFQRFMVGTDKEVSTTGAFARILAQLLNDAEIGKRIIPIIPDEARTFGLDALFRRYGIYASRGQLYEPVDAAKLLSYREAKDGQVLEEGICEAGATASFMAAGTSHVTHGQPMIPFYIFYSMFGFQRTGDQFWAIGDQRGRGFLIGATSGRTTLSGEGLQHQDGHSHLLASTNPRVQAYDPAYAYELAVIIQEGLHRMWRKEEDIFYYITVQNEPYPMPAMPKGVRQGIVDGLYRLQPAADDSGHKAQIFGSGSILREALRAQEILGEKFDVSADVWSATSYVQLRRDALTCERWNMLHPKEKARVPVVTKVLKNSQGPVIAVSDYMKMLPDQIARWVPNEFYPLGTDGFGRSDTRKALRRHFEIDAECIVLAVLRGLVTEGTIKKSVLLDAIQALDVDPDKLDPAIA